MALYVLTTHSLSYFMLLADEEAEPKLDSSFHLLTSPLPCVFSRPNISVCLSVIAKKWSLYVPPNANNSAPTPPPDHVPEIVRLSLLCDWLSLVLCTETDVGVDGRHPAGHRAKHHYSLHQTQARFIVTRLLRCGARVFPEVSSYCSRITMFLVLSNH